MLLKDYSCPTVRVKLKSNGEIYVINDEDFDDELHELEPEPEPPAGAPAAGSVSELLGGDVEKALQELTDIELEQLTNPGSGSVDLSE